MESLRMSLMMHSQACVIYYRMLLVKSLSRFPCAESVSP